MTISHRSSRPGRAEPKDDLISALAQAEIDGEKLEDEEIFSFLRLLLPAGVETTYRSLGNSENTPSAAGRVLAGRRRPRINLAD